MLPSVSVVIPAYNAAATLARAIRSALAQTHPADEILVVDDGSRDDTRSIAQSFGPQGVETIVLPKQSGIAAARNAGIERARGEYVAFLDADDEWLPDKTARQLAVISKHPAMVFISCHAAFISERRDAPKIVNDGRPPATGADAWKTLLAYSFVTASSILARRDAIIAIGMFDPASCPAENQDFEIRMARRGEIGFVEDILVRYYDTPGSETKRRPAVGIATTLAVVERHIAAAGDLLTARERRHIRALRHARLGRTAYAAGDLRHGIPLLLRAISSGHEPGGNLLYLAVASPPARALKHWIRRT